MGWLLPKSLNGFLLLGLGFLAGPLLLAILHAAVQMRRLSDTSQQLVVDSVQSTRLTQDMYAQIALLERAARLYQVLGEPTVRASFREHDDKLATIVGTLRLRLRAVDAPGQLQRLFDTQKHIESLVLQSQVASGQAAELAQSFVMLGDLANGVATLNNQQIDAESRELRGRTDQAQRELFLESTLLETKKVVRIGGRSKSDAVRSTATRSTWSSPDRAPRVSALRVALSSCCEVQ